jgi:hypothetical protein
MSVTKPLRRKSRGHIDRLRRTPNIVTTRDPRTAKLTV